jgi:hypothetical protein
MSSETREEAQLLYVRDQCLTKILDEQLKEIRYFESKACYLEEEASRREEQPLRFENEASLREDARTVVAKSTRLQEARLQAEVEARLERANRQREARHEETYRQKEARVQAQFEACQREARLAEAQLAQLQEERHTAVAKSTRLQEEIIRLNQRIQTMAQERNVWIAETKKARTAEENHKAQVAELRRENLRVKEEANGLHQARHQARERFQEEARQANEEVARLQKEILRLQEEARKAENDHKAEVARIEEEARKVERNRKVQVAQLEKENLRLQQEARKAEDDHKVEVARIQDQARQANEEVTRLKKENLLLREEARIGLGQAHITNEPQQSGGKKKAKLLMDGNYYMKATYKQRPDIKAVVKRLEEVYDVDIKQVKFVQGTDGRRTLPIHRAFENALPGICRVVVHDMKDQRGNLADKSGEATIRVERGVDVDVGSDIVLKMDEGEAHDVMILIAGDGDLECAIQKRVTMFGKKSIFVCGTKPKDEHKTIAGDMLRYVKICNGEPVYLDDVLKDLPSMPVPNKSQKSWIRGVSTSTRKDSRASRSSESDEGSQITEGSQAGGSSGSDEGSQVADGSSCALS